MEHFIQYLIFLATFHVIRHLIILYHFLDNVCLLFEEAGKFVFLSDAEKERKGDELSFLLNLDAHQCQENEAWERINTWGSCFQFCPGTIV